LGLGSAISANNEVMEDITISWMENGGWIMWTISLRAWQRVSAVL